MKIRIPLKSSISIDKNKMQVMALFLIVLSGSAPWMIWGYIPTIYVGIVGLFVLLLLNLGKVGQAVTRAMKQNYTIAIVVFFIYFMAYQQLFWGDLSISDIYLFVALFVLSVISDETKERTFICYSKVMGVFVMISLIAWITHKYIIQIPLVSIFDISAMKSQPPGTTFMNNHVLFVAFPNRFDRFYSVFDEPGVLGTIGALLLYANKYDFRKWYNTVIFIGCIPTFSMAFYILTAVGLALHYAQNVKKMIWGIFTVLAILGMGCMLIWNNASFQQHIVARFNSYDSLIELINGRDNDFVRYNFNIMLKNPISFLFGYGNNSSVGAGTSVSYMRWLLRYGLCGFVSMCVIFLELIKPMNKSTVGLCVLILLSFLQRPGILSTAFVAFVLICSEQLQCSKNVNRFLEGNNDKDTICFGKLS